MTVTFKTGFECIDFDTVTQWLSSAYWCQGITKNEVNYGAQNSTVNISGFDESGKQVSYMRIVSDKVRFAYILDVFVDPNLQNRGIGTEMTTFAMALPELALVYTWLLQTLTAQNAYAKVGFVSVDKPENWMIVKKQRGDRSVFIL